MTITYHQTDDLDACLAIRKTVFIDGQNVPANEEVDGQDGICDHYLAMDGDTPVGTCRVLPKGERLKIQRVAVLDSHRGLGIGRGLMHTVLREAPKHNKQAKEFILGAQVHAIPFYARLGFEEIGTRYMDAGIEHIDMITKIENQKV